MVKFALIFRRRSHAVPSRLFLPDETAAIRSGAGAFLCTALARAREASMIIGASRRADMPAFYAEWMMNWIRAGFCTVPNPFNGDQISRISLLPPDTDVIVFWTRNPKPLIGRTRTSDQGIMS